MRRADFPTGPELYCITDANLSGFSHEEQVARMIEGGARIIQLRDKAIDDEGFAQIATKCQALCRAAGVSFVVNDRIEVARAISADVLHLGQDDLPPAEARKIIGEEMLLGISTHNFDQFVRALREPVDYIALGPVFGTTTKQRPDPPPGMDAVREAATIMRDDRRPLVLIGGVTLENLEALQVIAPNAIIAVIGAIVGSPHSIAERVKEFRRRICVPERTSFLNRQ
ncbi:MAG TPA: thiamine phosphate synthase [Candidatus Sumerlaeota bacterium]|nr:thiamine phosphate synthase [Candidatus Sumerlaeota bacterium]HMZ50723.1 thiamine phosphate synthase [Candidatus Sumerlaeota bacterium]